MSISSAELCMPTEHDKICILFTHKIQLAEHEFMNTVSHIFQKTVSELKGLYVSASITASSTPPNCYALSLTRAQRLLHTIRILRNNQIALSTSVALHRHKSVALGREKQLLQFSRWFFRHYTVSPATFFAFSFESPIHRFHKTQIVCKRAILKRIAPSFMHQWQLNSCNTLPINQIKQLQQQEKNDEDICPSANQMRVALSSPTCLTVTPLVTSTISVTSEVSLPHLIITTATTSFSSSAHRRFSRKRCHFQLSQSRSFANQNQQQTGDSMIVMNDLLESLPLLPPQLISTDTQEQKFKPNLTVDQSNQTLNTEETTTKTAGMFSSDGPEFLNQSFIHPHHSPFHHCLPVKRIRRTSK